MSPSWTTIMSISSAESAAVIRLWAFRSSQRRALSVQGWLKPGLRIQWGDVRDDNNFLYAIVLLDAVRIETIWLIRSPDFNRLACHITESGREIFEFRGRPSGDDAFGAFRIDPLEIGPAIITAFQKSPHSPQWLAAIAGR